MEIPITFNQPLPGAHQATFRFSLDDFPLELIRSVGIELPFALRSAVKKRQYEFLAGRYCAQLCLERLGLHPMAAVGFADNRSPIWPPGFIGSITHTHGWASAVVGRRSDFLSIGLDIEHEITETKAQIIQHICRDPAEVDRLSQRGLLTEKEALTLVFSAKESLYKALFPRVQSFFGFHAAELIADGPDQFSLVLLSDLSDELLAGRRWPLRVARPAEGLLQTLLLETL